MTASKKIKIAKMVLLGVVILIGFLSIFEPATLVFMPIYLGLPAVLVSGLFSASAYMKTNDLKEKKNSRNILVFNTILFILLLGWYGILSSSLSFNMLG